MIITVLRKPLEGTVVLNTLKWGTGGINIDGTRISGAPPSVPQPCGGTGNLYGFKNGIGWSGEMSGATGRWAANLILQHLPGCTQQGTQAIKSSGHYPATRGVGGLGTTGHTGQECLPEKHTSGETVASWQCASGCPVFRLDQQSGNLSVCGGPKHTTHSKGVFGIGTPGHVFRDEGGASRFFKQVKTNE